MNKEEIWNGSEDGLGFEGKILLWRFICIILDRCEIGKVIAKKGLVRE